MDFELLLKLPLPAFRRIFGFLRFSELVALREAIPQLGNYVNDAIRQADREFFEKKRFKWNRCAPEDIEDLMAERHKHSAVYHPTENAIYCFGGEALGPNTDYVVSPATFNDFWKLDLASLKWSRVIVAGPPYPLPKCKASMVIWKDEIILYGGYQPYPRGPTMRSKGSDHCEIHIYNPKLNCWRVMITIERGPELSGHTATIIGNDRMLVYGGWPSLSSPDYTLIYILNLKQQKWHTVNLYSGPIFQGSYELCKSQMTPNDRFFPNTQRKKSNLISISKSLVLIAGELKSYDYGRSILLRFDPENPEGGEWQWKLVETTGRWWHPRFQQNLINPDCAFPNYTYHQIAPIRQGLKLRLVSVGKPCKCRSTVDAELYDSLQMRTQRFVKFVRDILEEEIVKRLTEEDPTKEYEKNITISNDGIECRVFNCFVGQKKLWAIKLNKNDDDFYGNEKCRIRLRTIDGSQGLDDVDLWELRLCIKATITQLHCKYYPSGIDDNLCAHLPLRNRALKRFHVYMAEIDIDTDDNKTWDQLTKIEWRRQPLEYRAAPDTTWFTLTSARHEIVMHGGRFMYNERMQRMGHTYVLSLAHGPYEDVEPEPNPFNRNFDFPVIA